MNPAIIGAAVHTTRKVGEKKCPECGKPLERHLITRLGYHVWEHFGFDECDYSEPETARKGK